METMINQLIFVYNAESGLFNAAADLAHKILSPSTYACQLCALTHSPLGMRRQWSEYLESLSIEKKFLHKDEWQQLHPGRSEALPAVFGLHQGDETGDRPILLLSADQLGRAGTLEELQEALSHALADSVGER